MPNVETHVYARRVHAEQYRRIRNACNDDICMDVNAICRGCRVCFINGYPCSAVVITLAVRQDIAAALTFECWPVAARAIGPVRHDCARAWLGPRHARHSNVACRACRVVASDGYPVGAVVITLALRPNIAAALAFEYRSVAARAICPVCHNCARARLGLCNERHSSTVYKYAGAVTFTKSPDAVAAIALKCWGVTCGAFRPYIELRARACLRRRVRGWLADALVRRAA